MIRSFKDKETERLFHDYRVKRFQTFETVARRKLKMLDDATSLDDLAALPGNRLEALRGDTAPVLTRADARPKALAPRTSVSR